MFSEVQLKTLEAAINRIIPQDMFPGGWQAGVGDYMIRQFQGDLNHLLPTYRIALDMMEFEAIQNGGSSFSDLLPVQQDALLSRIEQGEITTQWLVDPVEFFKLLVEHSAEGFYSDPYNGGNRNAISWQMIGFEVRG